MHAWCHLLYNGTIIQLAPVMVDGLLAHKTQQDWDTVDVRHMNNVFMCLQENKVIQFL